MFHKLLNFPNSAYVLCCRQAIGTNIVTKYNYRLLLLLAVQKLNFWSTLRDQKYFHSVNTPLQFYPNVFQSLKKYIA